MTSIKTYQSNRRPNIILIVLDSVRQDHLSTYGYSRKTTPNIDRLASQGVLFENAYSASCWTIPSHASLFTGLYPSQHEVDLDQPEFNPQHETLAGYLKTLGYGTACISCNSFAAGNGTDLNQGFDLTIDVEAVQSNGSGWVNQAIRYAWKRWRNLTRRDRGAQRATRLAIRWMDQQTEPFFLFMNYMDCHLPYRLKHPQRYQFIPRMERNRINRIPLDPFAAMAGALTLTPRDIAGIRALYDGSLYYLDQQVGRLVEALEKSGALEQTIFLVTSDHGESFGEHGLFDHQYGLYEHLLRVPLVARLPHRALAGLRSPHLIQHVDLFPLLRQILTGPGVWHDPRQYAIFTRPVRERVMAEYLVPNLNAIQRRFPEADIHHLKGGLRAIQSQGLKLICHEDGTHQLFDLARDANETMDLSQSKPEEAAELEALLQAELGPWPGSQEKASPLDLDEELIERLEAMGYL